jgi:probable rRNA maturation factor
MEFTVDITNEQDEVALPQGFENVLQQLFRLAGEVEGLTGGEVDLTLVDDEAIRELNLAYRGLDKPTDVLSFADDGESEEDDIVYEVESLDEVVPGEGLLGDIVISMPRAQEQATEFGHSLERELGFLFVHGILHLLGYDHQDRASEKEMIGKQEAALQKLGLVR